MPDARSGSLVYRLDPLAPAAEVLAEGDVVTEVDGVAVADDGTVSFRHEERVEFSHLIRCKHIGAPHPLQRFSGLCSGTSCACRRVRRAQCAWIFDMHLMLQCHELNM